MPLFDGLIHTLSYVMFFSLQSCIPISFVDTWWNEYLLFYYLIVFLAINLPFYTGKHELLHWWPACQRLFIWMCIAFTPGVRSTCELNLLTSHNSLCTELPSWTMRNMQTPPQKNKNFSPRRVPTRSYSDSVDRVNFALTLFPKTV